MNRHKIKILLSAGNKKFIEHLEDGYVGNKKVGYKKVKSGDRDIAQTRTCRHFDDMEHKIKTSNMVELIIQRFVCLYTVTLFFFDAFNLFKHLIQNKKEVFIKCLN